METHPTTERPTENRFILHRFNGDEVYNIKSAVLFAYVNEDRGVTLCLEAAADSDALQRCEDTADMRCAPRAETDFDLPELDAGRLVGRVFEFPGTTSYEDENDSSSLYYCEHEPLWNHHVRFLSRDDDRFRLSWTATARDVNYYRGGKPDTRVEIEGEFLFKNVARWIKA